MSENLTRPHEINQEDLLAYWEVQQGQLEPSLVSDVDLDLIERHLRECETCRHELREWERWEPFFQRMARPKQEAPSHIKAQISRMVKGAIETRRQKIRIHTDQEGPGLYELVLFIADTVNHSAPSRQHIEEGQCIRCNQLLKSPWLQAIGGLLRVGKATQEQVRSRVEAAISVFTPLPAPVGTFAPVTRAPFQLRATDPAGGLTAILRETSSGDLVVTVESSDITHAGRRVHVEAIGVNEQLIADIVLDPQGENLCAGRCTLGRFEDLIQQLGSDCALLLALVE